MVSIEDKLKKTLVVIPARFGSKGLPGKNVMPILNVPLMSWTICFAKAVGLNTIVVSTDSEIFAEVARRYGAETPFLRPLCLSGDDVESAPVVLHVIEYLESVGKQKFEYVLLLEPTSPIRRAGLINDAFSALKGGLESVVSVQKAGNAHPNFALQRNDITGGSRSLLNGRPTLRRQLLEPVYYPDGSLYLSKVETLREKKSFYHEGTALIEVSLIESLDIDDVESFALVEFFISQIVEKPWSPLFNSFGWINDVIRKRDSGNKTLEVNET